MNKKMFIWETLFNEKVVNVKWSVFFDWDEEHLKEIQIPKLFPYVIPRSSQKKNVKHLKLFLLDNSHNTQLETNGSHLTMSPPHPIFFHFPLLLSLHPLPFSPGWPETPKSRLPLKVKPLSEQARGLISGLNLSWEPLKKGLHKA